MHSNKLFLHSIQHPHEQEEEDAKEEKKKKNHRKEKPSMNGVIITVYVESPTIRSRPINDSPKRIKANPFCKRPQSARTSGYDRRAQLLAYARELRDADTDQHLQWPKSKKWRWWTSPARLKFSFRRIISRTKRRWRYEQMVCEEKTHVDRSWDSKCIYGKKTKAPKRCNSHFCKRLRCMVKGLSHGWQCSNGRL